MPDLLASDVALAPGDVELLAGDVTDAPDLLPTDEPEPDGACECCGGEACANFGPSVCFSLTAADCANLGGLQLTGAEALPAGACRHWSYAGGSIVSGGCTYTVNVDFYCGCADGAAPCPAAAEFSTCAYVTVGGTTNCVGGGTWRLVTAPDGTDAKLPVTWVAANPPTATVTGYVVPGAGETDCSCPCAKNTLITVAVTNGVCPVMTPCSCLAGGITVTFQNIDGCPCLNGLVLSGVAVETGLWEVDGTAPGCTAHDGTAFISGQIACCSSGFGGKTTGVCVGQPDPSLYMALAFSDSAEGIGSLINVPPGNMVLVSANCDPLELVYEGNLTPGVGGPRGTLFGCTSEAPRIRVIITI